MNLPIEIFLVLAPIAVTILVFSTVLLVINNTSTATRLLAFQLGLIAIWLIFNSTQVLSGQPDLILFLSKATYISVAFLPTAWFCFAIFFIGMEPHRRKFLWLVWIFPFLVLTLNWTNGFHHLIWKSYHFEQLGVYTILQVQHGPVFWIFAFHSYLLILWGSFLIIRGIAIKKRVYKVQAICLVTGALIPLVLNTTYLIGSGGAPKFDFSPLGYAFGSLSIAIGMFFFELFGGIRKKLSDVSPAGILGVVILDEKGRISMISESIRDLLSLPAVSLIGKSIEMIFPEWSRQANLNGGSPEGIDYFVHQPRPLAIQSMRKAAGGAGEILIIREPTNMNNKFNYYKILSEFDGLLNIFNRRAFLEKAEAKFADIKKEERIFSIIFFDIDLFKHFNDSYGHFFGDEILLKVTGVAQRIIRKDDLFGRYGGDEFIIFLADLSKTQANNVAKRLLHSISCIEIGHASKPVSVTVSIGIVSSADFPQASLREMINFADRALFSAKRAGRNAVQLYSCQEPD